MHKILLLLLLISNKYAQNDANSLFHYFHNYYNYFQLLRRTPLRVHDHYFKILTPKVRSKILISAPHTLSHLRNQKFKWADRGTGALALSLQRATQTHLIYTTRSGIDPNYYDDCNYKRALKNYLQKHPEIEIVIDLHGASPKRPFDMDLGTMYGKSILDRNLLNIIQKELGNQKFKLSDNHFSASKNQTITKFVRKLKINSIQIETNVALFHDQKRSSELKLLLKSYCNIIDQIKTYLN
ncbi:hypothetical protein MJH12_12420 [bacterium]|nr:hypothetical protein [bacterium]